MSSGDKKTLQKNDYMLESTTVIEKFIQKISNFQLPRFMCEAELLL